MGSVGIGELLLIFLAALLAAGPDRLPAMARDIARTIRSLRGVAHGLTSELRREVGLDEVSEMFRKHGHDHTNASLTMSGTLPPPVVPGGAPSAPAPSAGGAPASLTTSDARAGSEPPPSIRPED
ncbi:twin-arginine translocase TatA/TatE family subunit [Actinoplanes bogorensis]|uniref:Twin-arginine translocase TatA/TatE family subunit n=1 Tax=Paractinoplanes bogorensis TaxID=1610840 RepID=A0ABS5YUZ2_9ACTN|nr:twin-arginine translocase TatA/TatE family subunit [Actinoplanes bogorensis]MBU2667277.1 twin-arginine translocase TatA/TatE family subunit [Actinoplanes bogorensis]